MADYNRSEAQREYDRNADIAKIMSIFGVKDYNYDIGKSTAWQDYTRGKPSQVRQLDRQGILDLIEQRKVYDDWLQSQGGLDRLSGTTNWEGETVYGAPEGIPGVLQDGRYLAPGTYREKKGSWDDQDQYRTTTVDLNQLLADYDRYNIDPSNLEADALKNYELNQGRYAGTAQDVRDYFKDALERKTRYGQQQLGFALARRGQTGGSQAVDKASELQRAINEENVGLDAQAQEASNAAQRYDSQLREQIVSQVNDDTRAQTLTSTTADDIALNADRAFDQAKLYEVGRAIDEFVNLNQLGAYVKGRDAAVGRGFNPQRFVTPGAGTSYQGSVT